MKALALSRSLFLIDSRIILRESILRWMLLLPFFYAFAIRWLAPLAAEALAPKFDLIPYYPLIISYAQISITPIFYGLIAGFLLLDERDDDTLTAMRVTPMPIRGYILYRMAQPFLLTFMIAICVVPIANLVGFPFMALALSAFLIAFEGPMAALCMLAFAANKVQGFAVAKALGGVMALPLAAYFVSGPWQYAFGILPVYWPAKVFWIAVETQTVPWTEAGIGLFVNLLYLYYFLRYFQRTIKQ